MLIHRTRAVTGVSLMSMLFFTRLAPNVGEEMSGHRAR